jgi:glycerate 2-kinase
MRWNDQRVPATSAIPPNPPRRAVVCPAALKGVLSARAAATAICQGFSRAHVTCARAPLADGGEGTLEAFERALGGEERFARVQDPLGRPVEARWLLLPDGRGVVESAQAIGLSLLSPSERDPMRASSRGLGELVLQAAEEASELLVGLGDSATVDGGAGLRQVVASLPVPTTVLCDVRSPLLDAARVFAAQKGASPAEIAELESRLAGMEELQPYAEAVGAGAAGGLGAGLAALGATLAPGADHVIEAVGLRERIRGAALVVTGEGVVDRTSAAGKASGNVILLCREEGVRCVVFGGRVDEAPPGAEVHELSGEPARAREDLLALGERLARSL